MGKLFREITGDIDSKDLISTTVYSDWASTVSPFRSLELNTQAVLEYP